MLENESEDSDGNRQPRRREAGRMKLKLLVAAACLLAMGWPSHAASLSKRYSYFSINGKTSAEIETELQRRGPKVGSTGSRHPGATEMEFRTRLEFAERRKTCTVSKATVRLKARLILPRWRQRKRAKRELAIIWDTLSADIKRHEESHVIIAKNHARKLEKRLERLRSSRGCDEVEQMAEQTTREVLAEHDLAQQRFDRIEGISFERRMLRLLRYRLQQIEAGRLPG